MAIQVTQRPTVAVLLQKEVQKDRKQFSVEARHNKNKNLFKNVNPKISYANVASNQNHNYNDSQSHYNSSNDAFNNNEIKLLLLNLNSKLDDLAKNLASNTSRIDHIYEKLGISYG